MGVGINIQQPDVISWASYCYVDSTIELGASTDNTTLIMGSIMLLIQPIYVVIKLSHAIPKFPPINNKGFKKDT